MILPFRGIKTNASKDGSLVGIQQRKAGAHPIGARLVRVARGMKALGSMGFQGESAVSHWAWIGAGGEGTLQVLRVVKRKDVLTCGDATGSASADLPLPRWFWARNGTFVVQNTSCGRGFANEQRCITTPHFCSNKYFVQIQLMK